MHRFAVLGHPIAHSLSPVMHTANLRALGLEGRYEKSDITSEELTAAIRRFQRKGYLGLNLTIPHKTSVLPLLDRIDESVALTGACNTVKFELGGSITGYNTDIDGFLAVLAAAGFSLKGKRVLIVGNGGAGRALAATALREGAVRISIAGRSAAKAAALANWLGKIREDSRGSVLPSPGLAIVAEELGTAECVQEAAGADLVVNATPLGLAEGDLSPLPGAAFRPGQLALDLIPTRTVPPMASVAATAGATVLSGLDFLVEQGARSFELWTGLAADRAVMNAALHEVMFLYGPPAAGKTTLGRRLAAERGIAFVDLDEAIVCREGRTIPELFAAGGEAGFRAAENSALGAVLSAIKARTIIALGGGTLLDATNRRRCESVGAVCCLPAPDAAELERRLALAPASRPLGDRASQRVAHYASFPPFFA